jgi:hypothetical protein
MDIKNQWHTVEQLEQLIDLCRFYKVHYALFHTGAPQWLAATLESTANIPEKTRREYRLYTKAEMDGLIAYGKARGVHLFPHNESDPFPGELGKVLETDFTPDDAFKGWMDEIDHEGPFKADADYINTPRFREFLIKVAQRSLKQFAAGYDDGVLPIYHIGPVLGEGGATPAQARKMIDGLLEVSPKTKILFWNGIDPADPLLAPLKDKLVVCFYTQGFGGGGITAHLDDGWDILNCAWTPLYIVDQSSGRHIARTQEQVFNDWNLYRLGEDGFTPRGFDYNTSAWVHFDKPQWHDQLIGAMLCTWELHPDMHFNLLRPRLPAYMEHAWNISSWPYPADDYAEFAGRFAKTDALLQRMMFGFDIAVDGNVNRNQLAGAANISFTPTAAGTTIRYTQDESHVAATSPVYDKPIEMKGEQSRLNARAFNASGEPIGDEWTLSLLQFPIQASINEQGKGRPTPPVNESIEFKDDITIELTSALPGTIRYMLGDIAPTADSPAYDKPIAIHDSTRLLAQLFSPEGQRIGRPYDVLIRRTTPIPNLTLNKPVTVSTGEDKAKFAVDGMVGLEHFWDVNDGPQWLAVDLEQVHMLNEIDLYTYWDGGRYYQFFIEVSKDGKNWQEVADMRNNTTKATDQGYRCKFKPQEARYIRATLTKNSANPGLHIVELRAFDTKLGAP